MAGNRLGYYSRYGFRTLYVFSSWAKEVLMLLGRASGYCMSSFLGLKRSLCCWVGLQDIVCLLLLG